MPEKGIRRNEKEEEIQFEVNHLYMTTMTTM
jgi:hypothetical protein